MIELIAVFAVVGLLLVAILIWPWVRDLQLRGEGDAPVRRTVAPQEDGEELAAEQAAGGLNPQWAEALRAELQRRWRGETEQSGPWEQPPTSHRRAAIGLAIALLPLLVAVGWYLQAGSWRTLEALRAAQVSDPDARQIARITDALQHQLKRRPADPARWALLAESYEWQQRSTEAALAYGQANALADPPNPDWLVAEGENYARAHDHNLQGLPAQRFTAALAQDPNHPKALWYAGMTAAQARDFATARKDWERLASQNLPADARSALMAALTRVGGALPASAEPAKLTLHLRVSIAAALAAQLQPGATLFVYAQAPQGPPMPLAVQRMPATDFPREVSLGDSMSPMASAGLGHFDAWTVTARVSQSGSAMPQPGDLQGSVQIQRAQAPQTQTLVIDHTVPAAPSG